MNSDWLRDYEVLVNSLAKTSCASESALARRALKGALTSNYHDDAAGPNCSRAARANDARWQAVSFALDRRTMFDGHACSRSRPHGPVSRRWRQSVRQ